MSSAFSFAVFAVLVALLYQLWPSKAWRQALLVAANLVFLASFSQGMQAYLPFAAFLILGFLGLKLIQVQPKTYVPVVIFTLVVFIWLKKYAFVPGALFLPFLYVTLGLSYILFRVLHLMIVAGSGKLASPPGLLTYFDYTANFLTLSSGPIQLYADYLKTRTAWDKRVSAGEIAEGLARIILGLFKANVLALAFSAIHTQALAAVTDAETAAGKLGAATLLVVAYPLFLYCNFSGYIDIVLGAGRLFGFVLPENFNRPFAAESFLEFWNRWHITLSSWLKTHVYNALLITVMRGGWPIWMESSLGVLAFFVTFFLVGVWHGQTSEFLMYGVVLGFGVSINKVFQMVMTKRLGRKNYSAVSSKTVYAAVARGLTFTYFAVTLILFWSNWRQMRELESALGGALTVAVCGATLAGSTIVLEAWELIRPRLLEGPWNDAPPLPQVVRVAIGTMLLVATLAIGLLMNQAAPDIVYKAF